jgi:hypothetical protein
VVICSSPKEWKNVMSLKKLLPLIVIVVLSTPAFGWNDRGHMVAGRLAWRQLTGEQRDKVIALLKKHPHYEEFLIAQKPDDFSVDEWAFMRAGVWADWVRSHHANQFNKPTWHYINYPFVPPGSKVDPDKHQPKEKEENVVNQLAVCVDKIRNGKDDAEKAVYLTWLFHLVEDIHQPLHCVALFSETFPDGDRGGNLQVFRAGTGTVNLHAYWDGPLGSGTSPDEIGKDVEQIEKIMAAPPDGVKKELKHDTTFESWAREGQALAKETVYRNGEVKGAAVRGVRPEDAPELPADYADKAGKVARVQVGKAGTRLADQLRKVIP